MAWQLSPGQVGNPAALGAAAAPTYANIVTLATADGWHALYDVTNPAERTLSGADVQAIGDALGNLPDITQTTTYPQFSAGEFGALDGIEKNVAQRGLITTTTFTALTQPYFSMIVMRDDSITQAARYLANASAGFQFFTRNAASNPLSASSGTVLQSTHNKDSNAHIVEVLADGASSQIWVDGVSVGTGAMGAGDFDDPLAIGMATSTFNTWEGAIGPVLVYSGNPGSTKQNAMRNLLSQLTGIAV